METIGRFPNLCQFHMTGYTRFGVDRRFVHPATTRGSVTVTVHPPSELGRPHGLLAEERGLSFPFPFPDSTFDHERLDVYKAASV